MPSNRKTGTKKAGRTGGFILLEVLISTAIFALVAVGFARTIAVSADAIRRSQQESDIALNLSNRLAEAQVLPVAVGKKQEKPDARGVVYETEWVPLKLENKAKAVLPGMFRLTIRARWKEGKREETEDATIDVYRPRF